MRVISGFLKGRNLKGFEIDGTRPTMARVKESLLATLSPYLEDKSILDLYAGSGALGIEAISMGAKNCTFVDKNVIAYQTILENTKGLENVKVIKQDVFHYLKTEDKQFDIIFIDPPYQESLIQKTLDKIIEYNVIKEGGLIVCEYEKERFSCPLEVWREKKYGSTNIRIYRK